MGASTLVLLIMSPINILLNIALIHHTTLGFVGSPAALSITYWMAFFILALLAYMSPMHRRNGTWGGLQLKAVVDPKSCYMFLGLALPGILMVGTEW
jgi:MATE family multidrug resistance protein